MKSSDRKHYVSENVLSCGYFQGKMMKSIKRKKSLQASASANILSQLETSLINKQVKHLVISNLQLCSTTKLRFTFKKN